MECHGTARNYFTRKQNVRSTHLIVCEVWHTFESIKYVILVILLQLFNLDDFQITV